MKIKTAIILCAGFGKRLMPLTEKTPKPLLKINEISLLENTINLIKVLEIKSLKINTFYLSEKIKDFIFSNNFGLEIQYYFRNRANFPFQCSCPKSHALRIFFLINFLKYFYL